jgi:hypothetical protein
MLTKLPTGFTCPQNLRTYRQDSDSLSAHPRVNTKRVIGSYAKITWIFCTCGKSYTKKIYFACFPISHVITNNLTRSVTRCHKFWNVQFWIYVIRRPY